MNKKYQVLKTLDTVIIAIYYFLKHIWYAKYIYLTNRFKSLA